MKVNENLTCDGIFKVFVRDVRENNFEKKCNAMKIKFAHDLEMCAFEL